MNYIKEGVRVDVFHKDGRWESERPLSDQVIWFSAGTGDDDFGFLCYNIIDDSKKDYFPFSRIREWNYNYTEQVFL